MGDPTTPTEQVSSNFPQRLSMEFETQKFPISRNALSDPDKLKIFTELVEGIKKLSEVQHTNLSNCKAIWFEGSQSEELNKVTGLFAPTFIIPAPETEKAPDSGTLTFLCLSREKYQFTPLPKWLEDRNNLSLHERQISHVLLQVASGIDKLIEKGLSPPSSLSEVHVLKEQPGNLYIAPCFMPSLKICCVGIPSAYLGGEEGALEPAQDLQEPSKKVQTFISQIFEKLAENLEQSEKLEMIREEISKGNLSNLIKVLQAPTQGILFNVSLPSRHFLGRVDPQLKLLEESLITSQAPDSGTHTNIVIIQGKSGSGKSELVNQFCNKLIRLEQLKLNIIILNCESLDSLTASIYQFCGENGIQISGFTGNSKLLKDIFRGMLLKFGEGEDKPCKQISLVIFENLGNGEGDGLSEEVLDLVQVFNENSTKCSKLILVTKWLQSLECPVFKDNRTSMMNLSLLENIEEDICEIDKVYDKLEREKDKLLMILGFMNGNFGMTEDKLGKLISEDGMTKIRDLLTRLTELSLITNIDGVIRISSRCQDKVVEMLKKRDLGELAEKLLEAYQNGLSEDIICHASKTWMGLMQIFGDDKQLMKKWSTFPETIGTLAKSVNKLEIVTDFLRKAIKVLVKVNHNGHDQDNIEVLKLKLFLARYSLAPMGKVNEAVAILKEVADHCGPSPRGPHLGVKLRALIEVSKVHMNKGNDGEGIDKAIRVLQNVQTLASQKLATFEVDGDLNLLECRVLLGEAHFLSGKLEESKKIILEVIPLLSRKGDKVLINQAKFILGSIFRKTGDLVNALMLEVRVLEEREGKLFGRDHPESWRAKLELSYLYSQYDNYDKALDLLRELLEGQERALGAPTNLWSLRSMKAIAEVEGKRGNWEEALELWEAIELILEEMEGTDGEVEGIKVECQLSQAEVLMNLGQYKECRDILDLVFSLKISKKISGKGDDKQLEEILGRREKCEKSLDILGGYWLSLSESLEDGGGDDEKLERLGKKHEAAVQLTDDNQDHWGALRFLREILEEMEGEGGEGGVEGNNKFYLSVKADLARVLGLVGKFNESFAVYKEIIPVMEVVFGETDEGVMLCKDNMGQVFLFSGNQFLKRQMSNLKW